MSFITEFTEILDECINESFPKEKLSEDDRLNLEIMRESIIAGVRETETEKEKQFFFDNKELYRKFIKALFTGNQIEMKVTGLKMLKILNRQESEA